MRIVIVEDEIRIREGLEKLLTKMGGHYEVVGVAENGEEGLSLILKEMPDLIITDIRMPNMDGIEMLSQLRQRGCASKALVLSAYSEFAYAQQAIKLGVSEYLLKPIVLDELAQALRAVGTRLQQEREEARQVLPHILETLTHSNTDELKNPQVGILVNKARTYAQQHYSEGITLEEISQKLSVTPEYLGTQIHKELGITFGTMMKVLRVNRAKELLLSTDMKLYEIAESVGYTDAKYFARVFQQCIGIMPLEFRKLHKLL